MGHRAANSPAALTGVLDHVDVVEADVHRFRGRLEVRHAKTIGPLAVLWERWHLLPPGTPRPRLDHQLAWLSAALPAGLALMLDLKGDDPAMVHAVLGATGRVRHERGLIISARHWSTADALRGAPGVRVLHSVGSPRGLRALRGRYGPGALQGVAVDRRLLDAGVVADLRRRADWVWTWPVDDPGDGALLAGWGVTGLISDHPARLGALRSAPP
ncbi:MAG: hypothetical protein RIB67_03310 [Miltoncostaeaceae bacterium]